MKKVLVTGCAGFVGYHLVKQLLLEGNCEVVGVDDFSRPTNDKEFQKLLTNPLLTFIEGNLSETKFVETLPSDVDIIFHLAAINGTLNFYQIPYDVAVSCAIPTWNLVNRYVNSNLEKFIFAGTPESYASSILLGIAEIPTKEEVPLSITSPLDSRWSYASGKLFSESLVCMAAQQHKFPFLIVRLHNVYGPRMGPHHFIPDFLNRVKKGVFLLNGGTDTRSFLYIRDAVSDLISLSTLKSASEMIVNLGSDDEIQIQKVANEILLLLGIEANLEINASPPNSVSRRVPDVSRLNKLLGPRHRTSLSMGLAHCIKEVFQDYKMENHDV